MLDGLGVVVGVVEDGAEPDVGFGLRFGVERLGDFRERIPLFGAAALVVLDQIAQRFVAEGVAFTNAYRDYQQKKKDDAAAEAEKQAEEDANIAAVEAILGAPLPPRAKP